MFDIGWSELLIVLVVALVVVGPKDLPRLMRMVGRWAGKARAMAEQLRESFDDIARESELDELRTEIETLRRNNPVARAQDELNRAILPPGKAAAPTDAKPVPHADEIEGAEETPKQQETPQETPQRGEPPPS